MKNKKEKIDKEKLHEIKCVEAEKTIKDIAYIVGNDTPDALFVVVDNDIKGIVTDTDVIMKISKKDLGSDDVKVKEIMNSPVISVEVDSDIDEAVDIMVEKGIQKLLVTEDGKPIGVLYGEEVLALNPNKWKKLLFNQTIDEVYKIVKRHPKRSFTSTYNAISDMDKFQNLDSDVEFDLYVYQEGLVLVAYNYIKEHKDKKLREIKKEIEKDYKKLLDKYSK